MDHLPKNDFVSSHTGHLENTASLSYANLPNVHPFHYAVCKKKKKTITFHITTNLIRKFVLGSYQAYSGAMSFKSQILPLVKFQLFSLK